MRLESQTTLEIKLTAAAINNPAPLIANNKEANARNKVAATQKKNSICNHGTPIYTSGMLNKYIRNNINVNKNSNIATTLKKLADAFQKLLKRTNRKPRKRSAYCTYMNKKNNRN